MTITKQDFKEWYTLHRQLWNGYHIEKSDYKELLRLNHIVMEIAHGIHNKHMMEHDKDIINSIKLQ